MHKRLPRRRAAGRRVHDGCRMSEEVHEAAIFTFGYNFGRVKIAAEIIGLVGDAASNV